MVTEQGYSVPEAAIPLGINANLLYRWKQQIEDQQQGKVLAEEMNSTASMQKVEQRIREI